MAGIAVTNRQACVESSFRSFGSKEQTAERKLMWRANKLQRLFPAATRCLAFSPLVDGNDKVSSTIREPPRGWSRHYGCMGQFVSNPTYIRRAILYFYVIFSFRTPRHVSPPPPPLLTVPWPVSLLLHSPREESETEDGKLFSSRYIGRYIYIYIYRCSSRWRKKYFYVRNMRFTREGNFVAGTNVKRSLL